MNDFAGFPSKMVVLDTETTGGRANRDRVIEIALIRIEHGVVVGQWQQLIQPDRPVPPWITQLTGIDDVQLASAPRFAEIADTLASWCEDAVLVAHHARFDLDFLRAAFRRMGRSFQPRSLCSVKLSRRCFPTAQGHGLDAIIQRLGLQVAQRHRAMDDAQAVVALLQHCAASHSTEQIAAICKSLMQRPSLPSHLDPARVDALPNSPGVYYFLDAQGEVLYVGKSIHIQQRVLSHFADPQARNALNWAQQIHDIQCERTPSDFGAQLLENAQIKALSPRYNRRQTKTKGLWQLERKMQAGVPTLQVVLADRNQPPSTSQRYGLFRSAKQAQNQLQQLVSRHQLCPKLCGLDPRSGACFAYQLKKCRGVCCGQEPPERYQLRLDIALAHLRQQVWPWPTALLVTERAQDPDEPPVYHLIDHWLYLGRVRDAQEAQDRLCARSTDRQIFDLDAYHILCRFLLKPHPQLTLQPFNAMLEETPL